MNHFHEKILMYGKYAKIISEKRFGICFHEFFGQDFLNFFGPTVDFEDFFVDMPKSIICLLLDDVLQKMVSLFCSLASSKSNSKGVSNHVMSANWQIL